SDAKNSSINQVLDADQKQFLSEIGDSIQRAFYPSAVLDTFAAGKVLYEKIYYNPTPSTIDSFYQYSTDPNLAKYNVSFTDVGQGRGNYVADFNGANGRVFRFIMPAGGVKQGNFEPITTLVTPKKQQVMNLGFDYAIGSSTNLKTELAMSNYDANTFSKLNNGDDRGFAAKFQLNNAKLLKKSTLLMLTSSADYEYVQDKFRPLERLRNVEFSRDFGLPILTEQATKSILRLGAGLKNAKGNSLSYRFINYNRSDDYSGFQNSL